ncbi:hypothetical protein [Streptomyces alanosinicus]|uniref:Uncharacterized protein n=1 Tax=Streptomyces alanosinicus TaxID=68171 RepID=A0A918YMX3_9ACTN|nr:hypothetical protein [Streptomyces alanosinicus]GHE09167.1 hypothetical protein GCM10010339_60490 [Streptomyces alanosinicus]
MEPEEIAELRTMFVFTPPHGRSWGLAFEELQARLRERNPDTFTRVDDGGYGPVRGASMIFGITLDDEGLEGLASLEPEGVSVLDCNAHSAARFALWLRNNVAPADIPVMFNTGWGIEEGIEHTLLPDATPPRIVAAFVAHIQETGGLD